VFVVSPIRHFTLEKYLCIIIGHFKNKCKHNYYFFSVGNIYLLFFLVGNIIYYFLNSLKNYNRKTIFPILAKYASRMFQWINGIIMLINVIID
jgi:hypothetical protein